MTRLFGRRRRPAPVAPALEGIVIGDLVGPTAVVDDHGRIGALDASWSLEWGAGADDRWHVAHEEVAVRQRRLDDAPVLETALRVPGGDLVQRVASVHDGLGRALVVEFHNDSAEGLAVGLVVRSSGAVVATPDELRLGGDLLVVRAQRPAGGVVAEPGDPWPSVFAGPPPHPVEAATTDVGGGLVVALPHRQRISFTVVLNGSRPPERETDAESVAAGWRAVTAGAAAIDVPDPALVEAWRRIVPDLVVAAGDHDPHVAAEAAWFLDIAGLHEEADRARIGVVVAADRGSMRGDAAVAGLLALASRDLRMGEESGLADLVGPMAELAGSSLTADVLRVLALGLDRVAPDAADDARVVAADAPTGWPDPVSAVGRGAAAVVGAVLGPVQAGAVELLATLPPSWRGGPIDLRGLTTHVGVVSCSVRWHGERPRGAVGAHRRTRRGRAAPTRSRSELVDNRALGRGSARHAGNVR